VAPFVVPTHVARLSDAVAPALLTRPKGSDLQILIFLINIKILFKKELKIKKIPMRKRRLHRSTGVWISTALS
jgi:hypothetical protein